MILFTVSAAFFLYLYVSQRMGDVPDPAQFEGLTNFQDGKFRNLDPVVLDRKKIARKSNWLRKLTSREHFPPASLPILSATPEELAKPDMDFSVRWLGHASLLMEYTRMFDLQGLGISIEMVSDSGTAFAVNDTVEIDCGIGRSVSIFSPDSTLNIKSSGLEYPTDGVVFDNWWKATLNKASQDTVRLTFSHKSIALVMLD